MANGDLRLVFSLLALLSLGPFSRASSNSNPADELADLINSNRTAMKLSALADSAGLACIALQYVHDFQQECDRVGKAKPPDDLLNSTFASACGITPSSVTPLSGVLVYCQTSYVKPSQAFDLLLANSTKSLPIIDNANHTQFGVAVGSYAGGSPYYWAALFSDGPSNSTFVFSDGKPLMQHEGCFSGTGQPCSASPSLLSPFHPMFFFLLLTVLAIPLLS